MEGVKDRIESIIRTVANFESRIPPDRRLEEVVTSSLDFIVIVGDIETEFDFELPEEELTLDNFADIQSIAQLLSRLGCDAGVGVAG